MFSSSLTARRGLIAVFAAACVLAATPLAAQPANPSCASAVTIPGAGPFPYSIAPIVTSASFTDQGGWSYPCLTGKGFTSSQPNAIAKTVWFSFTPAVTDTYRIDTGLSTPALVYDTILEVYTGLCGSLQLVNNGCNDDAQGSTFAATNVVLTAGTTYLISVSGVGAVDTFSPGTIKPSVGGTLQLAVSRVPIVFLYSYVIPSVAHVSGRVLFVSDLNVTNLEGSDAIFNVQFQGHGAFGDQGAPASQPVSSNINVPAFGSKELVDVVQSTFGLSDFGSLLIQSTKRLFAGAKTYTAGPSGGVYGQYVEGVDVSAGASTASVLLFNETGRFAGIREDADVRTNFVLFNPGPAVCNVNIEVRDANGNVMAPGAIQRGVPPKTMVQANTLKDSKTLGITSDVRSASLVVKNTSAGCTIGGVAYVVDGNLVASTATNDPFTVTFRK
jgi:hypothetical protein